MVINRRRIPKWLLAPGLIMLLLSLLTGTLVAVARQQPDDDQQCLKITPENGDFSYVYFDVNSGTRLNLPRHNPDPAYELISVEAFSPDSKTTAAFLRSTTVPINGISLKDLTSGTRRMRMLGELDPLPVKWSSDSRTLAVAIRGATPDYNEVVLLSSHDLSDLLRVRVPGHILAGDWAPHSNRLAFLEKRGDASFWLSILNMDVPDSASRLVSIRLPDANQSGGLFLWSPDERYVALRTAGYLGIAPTDGGAFQTLSSKTGTEMWTTNPTTLAYIEVDQKTVLEVYDPRTQTPKILADDLSYFGSEFSLDGNFAILANPSSSNELTLRTIDLVTGNDAPIGKIIDKQKMNVLYWSNDHQTAVFLMSGNVLWADLHNPLHPMVHESPLENTDYWEVVPDNGWMRYMESNSLRVRLHYINLQTGDHYVWEHTHSRKDIYLDYWPGEPAQDRGGDMVRGDIMRIGADGNLIPVNFESGIPPWLATTKYLTSIGYDKPSISYTAATVYIRRTDGSSLVTLRGVGVLQSGAHVIDWVSCTTFQ